VISVTVIVSVTRVKVAVVIPVVCIARILPAIICSGSVNAAVPTVCTVIYHSLISSFEIAVYSLPVNGTPAVSCCYH
jgi:hypothetical protein